MGFCQKKLLATSPMSYGKKRMTIFLNFTGNHGAVGKVLSSINCSKAFSQSSSLVNHPSSSSSSVNHASSQSSSINHSFGQLFIESINHAVDHSFNQSIIFSQLSLLYQSSSHSSYFCASSLMLKWKKKNLFPKHQTYSGVRESKTY